LYVDSNLNVTKVKYWDIDLTQVNDTISIQEASEKLRDLFYQSIRLRLRSDVPVGSSLSGGLDSSSIVCAIDRMNADNKIRQKTFSARFKQFEKDEGKYMLQVINSTKADPYFIYPDEETFAADFDKLCFHQEEPFVSASVFAQWQVMKLAKQQGVTVLLDGQGADEVLAGYHFYLTTYLKELYYSNRSLYQSELQAYREKHRPNFVGFDEIEMPTKPTKKSSAKEVLKDILRPVYRQFFPVPQAPLPGSVREFLSSEFTAQFSKAEELPTDHKGGLREQLYVNTRVIGLHDLLRYADRNSMAFSREVRLPFLSHQLVEFLFTLPNAYKIHNGWTKYVMRKAFEDILPPEITWRTDKIGYEPPQKKWMQNTQMRDKVSDAVKKLKAEGVVTANNITPGTDDEWFSLVVANTLFSK
jgi:asparagine synthase (glutamine-hydrolysing)